MRKTVLYTLMSLDGDADQPDQYFPEFDSVMHDNLARVIGSQGAVLLGRHMFDEWSQYWPTSDIQPFADFINSVKKYVVTSTFTMWPRVSDTATRWEMESKVFSSSRRERITSSSNCMFSMALES